MTESTKYYLDLCRICSKEDCICKPPYERKFDYREKIDLSKYETAFLLNPERYKKIKELLNNWIIKVLVTN